MPASANQARYVKAELTGAGTYMIPMGHLVKGALDPARLAAAARALVLRHDALRTVFEIKDGTVLALVSPEAHFQLHAISLEDHGLDAFRRVAIPLIFDSVDPREPGSLVRIVAADLGDSWRFTIAAHHSITDGFSRGVMSKELLKLYVGDELAPARSYYDFAPAALASGRLSQEAEDLVASLPNPLRLVGDSIGRGDAEDAGQFAERAFEGLSRPLRSLSNSTGATRFGLLAAIYALGLKGFSGDGRVSSFFQTEGRSTLGAPNSVVGPFSNTLPLDLTVDPDATFAQFAMVLSERTRRAVSLETEPLLDRVLIAGKAPSVSINMFPPAGRIRAGTLEIGPREFLDRRTEFDLNLVWSEDGDLITARAFFNLAQLTEERAELFLELQGQLIKAAIANPQARCAEIVRIARQGRQVVLPQTTLEPTPVGRMHDRFFETAARSPDAVAVITSEKRVTYGDLALQARGVLAALKTAGIGEGDSVAILAQRDTALVAAMLGVSASGATFGLIDATYPVERMRRMIDRMRCRFVVEAGASLPTELRDRLTALDTTLAPAPLSHIVTGPARAAACHMFTSGTTGRPKLITHPDTTLLRFVDWQAATLALPDPICTLMMAGLAHDPTLRDVFLPLSHGGAIAIPAPGELTQPELLRALLSRAKCNVVRFSPTTARLLTAGQEDFGTVGSLRAIFWGGERLPHSEVRRWQNLVPGVRQFHIFGTTETPQAFLFHEIDPTEHWTRSIPLGCPLPWTGVALVDDDGTPVATGEVGEIVAALADPVAGSHDRLPITGTGASCHHFTGDIGYQLRDGRVYFVGRRDGQVKINGFRVELAEIEATAEATEGVERAQALIKDERIVLFVQSRAQTVTERSLRATLARTLPAYMLPAQIMVTDRFPSTSNGKVDGPALLAALQSRKAVVKAADATRFRLPEEAVVAAAFAARTGRPEVTRDDTLEDLGADSLATIELRLELEGKGFMLPEDWPFMPVSELAKFGKVPDKAASNPAVPRATSRVETFVLMRALAIVAVVFFHSGYPWTGGASIMLFVLAGFSFARLQLKAIAQDDHSGRVWALIARLLIPLLLMSVIYLGMNAYRGIDTDLSALLLYDNLTAFIDSVILDRASETSGMPWLWFLHVYLQTFALLGLVLSFPAPRRQLRADPWRSVFVFFLIVEAVGVLAVAGLSSGPRSMVEAARLLHQSPLAILPFLAVGALLAMAQTQANKLISMAIVAVHFGLVWVIYPDHREAWWIVALAICAFVPHVSLPGLLARLVVLISAYSLMIYLAHPIAFLAFYKFFGGDGIVGLVNILFQIGTGTVLGIIMRKLLDQLGVNRLSGLKATFFPSRRTDGMMH
ncbi:MAG: AMP-binding protein [Rhodobacteraceae bacterium]|nr:AMP-binding protein [Paracoccaceae bacterium]